MISLDRSYFIESSIKEGLFLSDDWHIPYALPDETLFSWCARFHHLNLGHDSRETSRMLFGHPRAGLRHDIPFALTEFERRTDGHLGPSVEILHQRTIFGFYAKFLPPTVAFSVEQLFLGTKHSFGRGKLGLKKTDQNRSSQLRFCQACLTEQQIQHSHSWWQLAHQLPTAFACTDHSLPLQIYQVEKYRGISRDFQLPALGAGSSAAMHIPLAVRQRLDEITKWGSRIWRDERLRLTDDILRWCYRLRAKERGWVAFDGSLRMQEMRDAFVSYYGETIEHFDADLLGDLAGVNGGFLAYLFRQAPSRRHPLKHVVLMNFLFERFELFEEVFHRVRQTLDFEGPLGCEMQLRSNQVELIQMVTDFGQSLSKAASALDTSVTSAARFIDKQGGIPRNRRPHIIGKTKEVVLRQLLHQGISRNEIAEKAGVRRSYIKDYLAKHPELKLLWESANNAKEKEKHRAQLQSTLEAHPGLPIKAIRRLPQNAFQWLYNNDRDWLREILPAIWKR